MSLSPGIISSSIISSGPNLIGPNFPLLAQGIGAGVYQWVTTSVQLIGQSVGAGVSFGVTSGTFQIPLNPGILLSSLQSANVAGVTSSPLASAIATGLFIAFNSSAQYQGVSSSVANGVDTITSVIADPISLISILTISLASSLGGSGPSMGMVASGLGTGIASIVQTGFGAGLVTGVGGPLPASGVSFSSIF